MGESNFLQSLGWAVLNSLWQLALLWVVYQVITGISRKMSSSHKSLLATTLLFSGFGWFIYTFFHALTFPHDSLSASVMNMQATLRVNEWLRETLPVASVLYLVLLVLPLLNYIRNFRYVQVIRYYGLQKANVEWRMFVNRIGAEIGIKKKVHIWVSEIVTSPVTIGYLKPVILLPLAAVNHLTVQQLEAVLLHELSHIRRHDYLLNLIIRFIQSILYYNPFAKAFADIIEKEREKSCDEMVMQYQYDAHGYASALLELEKAHHIQKSLTVAASGKKNHLLHRIECILGVKKQTPVSFNKIAGVFAGLLCIIGLNTLLILTKPSVENRIAYFNGQIVPLQLLESPSDQEMKVEPIINDIIKELPAVTVKAIIPSKKEVEVKSEKVENNLVEHKEHSNPLVHYVAQLEDVLPKLDKVQVAQVKEAMDVSKRVLEEGRWKQIENNLIGEVLSLEEKEQLKIEYMKEMSKIDWKKMENKLITAYNKIDWEKITVELDHAMSNIRMDSLQRSYSMTLNNLASVQKQMAQLNIESIPDSDISVDRIEQKKAEVLKAMDKLKQMRSRKTVHL